MPLQSWVAWWRRLGGISLVVLVGFVFAPPLSVQGAPQEVKPRSQANTEFYIAPSGKDAWSGRLARPNRARTDGPLASFPGTLARLRALKDAGALQGPVTVYVRGGVYRFTETLRITPDDPSPLTFTAYRNERPVIDGSFLIADWKIVKLNGRPAWVADLPDVAGGKQTFRSLFVNGTRAARPRLPREGLFRVAGLPDTKLPANWETPGGTQRFLASPNDIRFFRNLADVDIVALHYWVEERSPIAAFDPVSHIVTLGRPTRPPLIGADSKLADYYLDNVFEALSEPGQWYLDRPAGKLYYLPRPGQAPSNTEVAAPRLLQLVTVIGRADGDRFVEDVHFRGLTFRNTDWRHPGEETGGIDPDTGAPFVRGKYASAQQAANDVPGVVRFIAARNCSVERCSFLNLGWYAVDLGEACSDIRLQANVIRDLGAGGVKINGASAREKAPQRETHHVTVSDSEISQLGLIFHSAVGVLSMNAHHVAISHNHIHHTCYSGVSCGWSWGYGESASHHNTIEFNHIHDIGQGVLSDMGGVYLLGVQPGTVVRNNLIHDVRSAQYGAYAMYPDEGSSNLLIENNVVYDSKDCCFFLHYGRDNVVRNNIFAVSGSNIAYYVRNEPHVGMTFERNILVSQGHAWYDPARVETNPVWASELPPEQDIRRWRSDFNLFWDAEGRPPVFLFNYPAKDRMITLSEWQRFGNDTHSLAADPMFRNFAKRDFTLSRKSPALKLGFIPIDLSRVGPRR